MSARSSSALPARVANPHGGSPGRRRRRAPCRSASAPPTPASSPSGMRRRAPPTRSQPIPLVFSSLTSAGAVTDETRPVRRNAGPRVVRVDDGVCARRRAHRADSIERRFARRGARRRDAQAGADREGQSEEAQQPPPRRRKSEVGRSGRNAAAAPRSREPIRAARAGRSDLRGYDAGLWL